MTITQEQARQEIGKLVAKYQSLTAAAIKKYTEADTRRVFILPLFSALGWDVSSREEVTEEESISRKRVDYAFRLRGIPKFFLEAKSLKADLDNPEYAKQAINYAYHKGTTWAVLSDFEGLKVFNAEWKEPIVSRSLFFELSYDEYLSRFDWLWLLSREAFEQSLLDQKALDLFKKTKKTPVGQQLFSDLVSWRGLLDRYLSAYNKKYPGRLIDESVQRILDRLIFIRTCEDREIEPPILRPLLREWQNGAHKNLVQQLKHVWRDFDQGYDSHLFLPHLADELECDPTPFAEIIEGLYATKDRSIEYNFNAIDADVLGGIYEQYLEHLIKRAGKEIEVIPERGKRKSQGIYYTPKFVVRYIIENTLGPTLEGKPLNEARKIRILDPACGSGSFLVEALDYLERYWRQQKWLPQLSLETNVKQKDFFDYVTKVQFLTQNLYGVDLDAQAVEIAQLNLLLKALNQRQRLPDLVNNIFQGNSLISGTEEKVKSYFGENWREKKPFNWEQEFKDIMADGGFDVVIGNPPYQSYYSKFSQKIDRAYVDYYLSTYDFLQGISGVPRISSIMLFLDRAIQWAKPGGRIGFVLDQELLDIAAYGKIRKYILDKCFIDAIVAKARFPEINLDTCIIILRKKKAYEEDGEHATCWVDDIEQPDEFTLLRQEKFRKYANFEFTCSLYESILSKVETVSQTLDKVSLIRTGMCITREDFYSDEQLNDKWHPGLFGSNVQRYFLEWPSSDQIKHTRGRKRFLCFDKNLEAEVNKRLASQGSRTVKVIGSEYRFIEPKLLVRQGPSQPRIEATYDNAQFYAHQTLHIINEKQTSLKFLLAILNSKLMGFYARESRAVKYGPKKPPQIRTKSLATLPIRCIDFDNPAEKKMHDDLVALVDRMLELNKRLAPIRNTPCNERDELLREINRTDNEIDNLVYDLYGLMEEERRIVGEGNFLE